MKNFKNLLLIVLAPAFVLFLSWVLSTYNDFEWTGIIFFVVILLCLQVLLCVANSEKLMEPTPGFMISGSLYAFIAADMCGNYEPIFSFFAMIMFAFTLFFVCFPHVLRWRINIKDKKKL